MTRNKIIKDFGKFANSSMTDFDDERFVDNGWWWYSQDPFTYDDDCHTFHESTLEELYKAIEREAKRNNWEEKYQALHKGEN